MRPLACLLLLSLTPDTLADDSYDLLGQPPTQSVSSEWVESDKRQILFFTGDWCGVCQKWKRQQEPRMKASGWKFGSEKDLRTHIRTIDDRKNPELVKRFAIKSFPTFLIVDRGEVIERLVGYRTAEALNASYNRKRDDERKPE